MRKIEMAVIIGLLISIFAGSVGVFAKESGEVRESVLRLHILANSDSDEDQELKLKVRDKILEETGDLFTQSMDLEEAEIQIKENLPLVEEIAQNEVKEQGYDYPVRVEFTNMFFTTRTYEEITLPAGRYDALRITIGEAEGQNWWCVLYPPMCIPAAESKQEIEDVLEEEGAELVQSNPKYEVRFKVVEFIESIKDSFLGE